ELIAAPGALGEVRLVARRVKTLLLQGVAPEEVLVTLCEVAPYADLIREVFDECEIPIDLEGTEPLTHNPAVSVLLRALRLPDGACPFAAVTAAFGTPSFRPACPETDEATALPQRAEALLRLLGEPRGRDAYLAAVQRWAERQQPGLEDEQAEEQRR